MRNKQDALHFLSEFKEALEYLDKRERLEYLIDYGKNLDMDDSLKTDAHKVPGCVSNVHLVVEPGHIKASADALIVRGYVKFLVDLFEGLSKDDILSLENELTQFVEHLDLASSMVATRANAFGNIFAFIKNRV